MKKPFIAVISWLFTLWTAKVFLASLPYKFTGHPDTQHIFGTIGQWMEGALTPAIGQWFIAHGAVAVGSVELLVSLLLLSPALFFVVGRFAGVPAFFDRALIHGLGGLAAAGIMTGAVFFHLATPLGIKVLHQGNSDNGSLFYAASSILVMGLVVGTVNLLQYRNKV